MRRDTTRARVGHVTITAVRVMSWTCAVAWDGWCMGMPCYVVSCDAMWRDVM